MQKVQNRLRTLNLTSLKPREIVAEFYNLDDANTKYETKIKETTLQKICFFF